MIKKKMNELWKSKFDPKSNSVHIVSLSCNSVPPVKYGGIELIVTNLCEGFDDLGVNVFLYSPGETTLSGINHIKTINRPSTPLKEGGEANTLEHLRAVGDALKIKVASGDVILFNHADQFRYLKKYLGRYFFLRKNTFEVAHWMDAGLYKDIIYPSKSLRDVINKKGYFVPHGVDLLFACDRDLKNKKSGLFYAGRITEDKGVHIALEAAKILQIKLKIAGPDPKNSYSQKILCDDMVEYLGELTYSDLFAHYASSKAHVYMTQYIEPFGLSVIESLAAGTPVITTGLGGTGETINDGVNGFIASTAIDVVKAYNNIGSIDADECIKSAKKFTKERMAMSYLRVFLGEKDLVLT